MILVAAIQNSLCVTTFLTITLSWASTHAYTLAAGGQAESTIEDEESSTTVDFMVIISLA